MHEDYFQTPAESHDVLGQDQFLNLGDDTQTQAGSIPSMEFAGSSICPDSISSMGRPSPVLNATPMNYHGSSFPVLQDAPGFATLPQAQDMNGHVAGHFQNTQMYSGAQHLPGCPSARHGTHHHHSVPLNQDVSQHANHQAVCNLVQQNWSHFTPGQVQDPHSPLAPVPPAQQTYPYINAEPMKIEQREMNQTKAAGLERDSLVTSRASSEHHNLHSPAHTDLSHAGTMAS